MAEPKFCRHDKKELLLKEIPFFNAYTGEDEPLKFLQCPDWSGITLGIKHDRYQLLKTGDRFIKSKQTETWVPLDE